MISTASFMAKQSQYPLRRSFILDSGSTCHVCNDIRRFTTNWPSTPGDFLWAGNAKIWIQAYGTVVLRVNSENTDSLHLRDVAYCPDLHCNLVSFRLLRRQGLWWDTKTNPTTLRRNDDTLVATLEETHGQWVFKDNSLMEHATFATQQSMRRAEIKRRAKAIVWHKRLGHPGPNALEHLVQQSEGVRIVGVPTVKCDACGISKSKRLIRRQPRTILEGPGERVAVDFHDYEEESNTKEKSQMLITCRVTAMIWDFYFKGNRTARSIISSLNNFFRFMERQFGIAIKVLECDNELFSVKAEVNRWLEAQGIRVEPSAPDTQAQNGGAERSGGVVKEKGRAMRLDANLPRNLWPEVARTAVYLHNRTPKYLNRWKTPYEVFFTAVAFQNGIVTSPRKPNLSHLRAYGCKAFAMTDDTKRGKRRLQRFDPKAWIGYLVGYRSTNIYRIWIPSMGKVINTRDVIFDEDSIFNGEEREIMDNLMHSTTEEIEAWAKTVELPPTRDANQEELRSFHEDETIFEAPESQTRRTYDKTGRQIMAYPTPPPSPPAAMLAHLLTDGSNYEHFQALVSTQFSVKDADHTRGEHCQQSDAALSDAALSDARGNSQQSGVGAYGQQSDTGGDRKQPDAAGYGLQCDAALSDARGNRKQSGVGAYGQQSDIGGDRKQPDARGDCHEGDCKQPDARGEFRKQSDAGGYGKQSEGAATELQCAQNKAGLRSEHRAPKEPWAAAFMAGTKAGNVQRMNGKILDSAQLERMLRTGKLPHRSELPPAPTSNGLKEDHPLYDLFKKAEEDHLASHQTTHSWTEVPAKTVRLNGHQILDSMWVYTYKLDKHHRFQKCKARLVVRGDQQKNVTAQETYAATLAGRSFRMLMSIAARFNLELKQYDVSNAFPHAEIDRLVYMHMPRGYKKKGTVLQLNKALYGLRISPLLWQRNFTTYLKEKGFSSVPHEPCCMIRDKVFVFFYVDDIIIAYHQRNRQAAEAVVRELKEQYSLTGGKDLQWFLGVEVLRDRTQRKIWLSQAAYVDKIARLATDKDIRHNTPMGRVELEPREGFATHAEINRYQRKIGSLLFAAVNTRPDVAFSVSRLARFLTNPGPAHQQTADRVLLYLQATKTQALSFGGEDTLVVASDASFADNTIDRKSSQGFIIKLFGGLIAWRANKQDTVTTSTTEAELLALAQVAKEAMFVRMLTNELGLSLVESEITIQCDNTQTIRLITEEISQLTTKLRHVDIHNHWLRQKVQRKSIKLVYVQSGEMLADGLTKTLPGNRMPQFLKQLGLEDVKERISVPDADLEEITARMEALENR